MNRQAIAFVFAASLAVAGCGTITMSPPAVDQTPVDATLARLAQPVFYDQYAGRNVRIEATLMTMGGAASSLIPPQYHDGYVSLSLMDGSNAFMWGVAPASMAEQVMALGTNVRVRILAYAEPTILSIRGQPQQKTLLLVVASIERVGAPAPRRRSRN